MFSSKLVVSLVVSLPFSSFFLPGPLVNYPVVTPPTDEWHYTFPKKIPSGMYDIEWNKTQTGLGAEFDINRDMSYFWNTETPQAVMFVTAEQHKALEHSVILPTHRRWTNEYTNRHTLKLYHGIPAKTKKAFTGWGLKEEDLPIVVILEMAESRGNTKYRMPLHGQALLDTAPEALNDAMDAFFTEFMSGSLKGKAEL
jgi:hypothetical protein